MSRTYKSVTKRGSGAGKKLDPHARAGLYLDAPGAALAGARQGRRNGGRAGQGYREIGRAAAGRVVDNLHGGGQSGSRRRGDHDDQQLADLGDEIC